VKHAKENNSYIALTGLTEEGVVQYIANILGVEERIVPNTLRQFVAKMTLGNPLYIRETLAQLKKDEHIVLNQASDGKVRSVDCKEFSTINIAEWHHTAMVGGTVCTLESLEPIEAAAMKMSTCFMGPFTLPDLAASNCSQWGGATRFDTLRLYRATRKLVALGVIEIVDPPSQDGREESGCASSGDSGSGQFGKTQYFRMQNMLVRTAGAAMVLESQRKAVKRNALIDRVLKQDLPQRMDALVAKKAVHHIPWYYEQAMRRMM